MLSFKQIHGQDAAIELIRRAYAIDRLPHGLLLAGPAGVGKGTTAAVVAALFLCERPQANEPCGQCASCKVFEAGNHPDYHVIAKELVWLYNEDSAAKELSVEVMREHLIVPAGRKPAMNRGKVFVIEQAEVMSVGAQNACLKTLEEPPGRALIILLTDQPNALLATIRSRCQMVRFAALDEPFVRRELQNRGVPAADVADLAGLADGSLGLALRWWEDGILPHARQLKQRLQGLLEAKAILDLPEFFKGASDEYVEMYQKRDDRFAKTQLAREALTIYFRQAAQFFRRQLADEQEGEVLERLCGSIEAISRAQEHLDTNVNNALIFQQLAVTLERLWQRTAGVI